MTSFKRSLGKLGIIGKTLLVVMALSLIATMIPAPTLAVGPSFTITASSSDTNRCTVSPASQDVDLNSDAIIQIFIKPGNQVSSIIDNSTDVTSQLQASTNGTDVFLSYVIASVNAAHTVVVNCSADPFAVTITAPVSGTPINGNNVNVNLNVNTNVNASCLFSLDKGQYMNMNGNGTPTHTAVMNNVLEAVHTVIVRCTDSFTGNIAYATTSFTVRRSGGGGGGGGGGGSPVTNSNTNTNNNGNANQNGNNTNLNGSNSNGSSGGSSSGGGSGSGGGSSNNTNTNGIVNGNSNSTTGNSGTNFTDIAGHWAERYIKYLAEKGCIEGFPGINGTREFRPNQEMTRAQLVKILIACEGGTDISTPATPPFSDVPVTHFAAGYIAEAKRLGFISGYPDGTFKPDQTIIRVEGLKMILLKKFLASKIIGGSMDFTDTIKGQWYEKYVAFAQLKGFVTGYLDSTGKPTGKFGPADKLLRAHGATLVARILFGQP